MTNRPLNLSFPLKENVTDVFYVDPLTKYTEQLFQLTVHAD